MKTIRKFVNNAIILAAYVMVQMILIVSHVRKIDLKMSNKNVNALTNITKTIIHKNASLVITLV